MGKSLIINCDDFGMCRSVNEASVRAVTEGAATSLSIMAPAPFFAEAVALALRHGITHVGVHLCVTSEFSAIRWGGVSPAAEVSSLLDRSRCFHKTVRGFAARARADEVLVECERQIEAVLRTGLIPTHLDCHMFALHQHETGRKDLKPVIRELCEKYRLPFRSPFPEESHYLARHGIPMVRHAPTTTYDFPAERKFSAYVEILKRLKPGVSELIVHPAVDGPDLRSLDAPRHDHSSRRIRDYEFVCSEDLRATLQTEGVALVAWQDVF